MTLEDLSARYGEQYFTVSLSKHRRHIDSFISYGTLESIVSTMDATIYGIDPDAADLEAWSATISDSARALVYMPDYTGPDSAEIHKEFYMDAYEVREIDGLAEYDDPDDPDEPPSWTWNTSYLVGTFSTAAQDTARAFRHYLKTQGVTFRRGITRTEFDGDVYEIVDRKTGAPRYAAIPMEA